MYKLIVQKLEDNPKYKEPGPRPYSYREEDPTENMKYFTIIALETILKDEEFQAVKKSVLEVM